MLIVSGHVVIKAEARDELLASVAPILSRIRTEDGVVDYCLSADPVHDDRVTVLEIWASVEQLQTHLDHPNHRDMGKVMAKFRPRGGSVTKYRVTASAPMIGADGKPNLDFPES
jgi:quinol monooxygenase YgiN